ncbi:hypothetical protein FB563_3436 [Streptomyces puniciscabiei]|uniref:DUF6545 domain-containing protein n=1 Tax=Streptomyces puniciscabiei TaxID=164348 RepID=A0A542UH53_9ACTN|nr:MAB_1171c family putative transporter [Streptomyces puniciscabiei]TQK98410.1 hypothetical protein FB563_3436 [Streptomyces puniciscabiei]
MTVVKHAALILLWAVTAWRLPGAVRVTKQRALWLAFASIAAATTLGAPGVARSTDALIGIHDAATLGKNLLGIVASAAVLDFVISIARPAAAAGARRWLIPATASTMAVLAGLFAVTPRPIESDNFFQSSLGSVPGTAYCLVFLDSLGLAMAMCTWLFWGSGRHAGAGWLRIGLRLLGTGTALGAGYSLYRSVLMILGLLRISVDGPRANRIADVIEYTAIALIIVGSSIPAMGALRRSVRDWHALRSIRPLWASLTSAVPEVVLDTHFLRPSPRVRLHRAVIEVRDAALILARHAPAGLREQARRAAEQSEPIPALRSALEEAIWLHAARAARLAGAPIAPTPTPTQGTYTERQDLIDFDFEAEVARLRSVSTAYQSRGAQTAGGPTTTNPIAPVTTTPDQESV